MRTMLLVLALVAPALAGERLLLPRQHMAPDGTYVDGDPHLTPDGDYVGGDPRLAPDDTYTGSRGKLYNGPSPSGEDDGPARYER